MSFLSDTNVLSELARQSPDAGVLAWAASVSKVTLSVVTLEEISYGLSWKPNGRIQLWFDRFVERHCDVLPVTPAIAVRCGQLRGQLQAAGQTRSQADMLIAATAAAHALTLVTRNTGDFEGTGIALLNPFAGR